MKKQMVIIELLAWNHPGVMAHVTGLFSRRGFNLEGILCRRTGNGEQSRMCLLVERDRRIGQVLAQLRKLHDVTEVRLRKQQAPDAFGAVLH